MQPNYTWSPSYLQSVKDEFDAQYARDKLIDLIYSEPRRVRRAAPAPAEGYHHPNEINGVRLLRKGRGQPPAVAAADAGDARRGKGVGELSPAPTSGGPAAPPRRGLAAPESCPQDGKERLWPFRGRGKPAKPADALETAWPTKGKRIVAGASHNDHGVLSMIAWDPDVQQAAQAAAASRAAAAARAAVPAPPPAERFGRRVSPLHNRSSITFG
ncbi:hypothetical protein HT031_006700 [Scenedesmus sp. PABB004]|nr:hypothetical protein HT031_006700 [Scenedesmus sp. PABB004]